MEDFGSMNHYSWGGMALAYLYHSLYVAALPRNKSLGWNLTLLKVVILISYACVSEYNVFFFVLNFFYLVITYKCVWFVHGWFLAQFQASFGKPDQTGRLNRSDWEPVGWPVRVTKRIGHVIKPAWTSVTRPNSEKIGEPAGLTNWTSLMWSIN